MESSVFVCLGRSANCRLWLQINKPITMARIIASQSLNISNLIKQMRNEGNSEILAGIKRNMFALRMADLATGCL